MKQIHKYLPYNPLMLWGTDNSAYYKNGERYSLQDLMFCPKGTSNYDYDEFVEWLQWNNVKPLLRPFEDLTKELPLTKAAAKMIGMNEGDTVIPLKIIYFIHCNIHSSIYYLYDNPEISEIEITKFDDNISKGFKMKNQLLVMEIYENYGFSNYREYDNGVCTPSRYRNGIKWLDFLRAMHFAVDFEEDSYIKLED